ncbi:MAG: hypothetical protein HYU41_03105 [Candidatus Rokubacteria bacterium]|nr:hypothetical protein [Candidatus Rokubacteria bacterium]
MRALLLGCAGLLLVVTFAHDAPAQQPVCSGAGFAVAPGVAACDGSGSPVTVSATVKTYARLSLEQVFGNPAASLQFAMGDIDASCVSSPIPGVTCMADYAQGAATWFGDVRFRVKLSGIGATRAKLVGVRPAAGTIPAGRLLDGAAGTTPTAPYPVAPATAADLRTSIGSGDTVVTRSIGLKVLGTDPAGAWSGDTAFSLVLE